MKSDHGQVSSVSRAGLPPTHALHGISISIKACCHQFLRHEGHLLERCGWKLSYKKDEHSFELNPRSTINSVSPCYAEYERFHGSANVDEDIAHPLEHNLWLKVNDCLYFLMKVSNGAMNWQIYKKEACS
jgi:hypothetical protein